MTTGMRRSDFRNWLCIESPCKSEAGCGCLAAYDAVVEECARMVEKFHNPNEPSSARVLAIIAAIRDMKDKP